MTVRQRLLPAWAPLALLVLLGCISRGEIRVGRVHVYDPATTRQEFAAAGKRVVERVRSQAAPGSPQETFGASELHSARLSLAAQPGAAPGAAPPSVPAPLTTTTPALPELPSSSGLTGTVGERIDDILRHEGRALELELLFSGAGDPDLLGPNARIYLLRFDIALLPNRQIRWLYPLYWVRSGFGSAYNFTRGWFVRTQFWLPELRDEKGRSLIYVYDIDPRNDTVAANEAIAALRSGQLNVAGMAPQGAAQAEFLRQLREEFAQQRRYPLQMGVVDGETTWSWTFGPRRRVERRSALVRWIPFVTSYKVASRLEPGPRTGHAILVVPDIVALRDKVNAVPKSRAAQGAVPTVGLFDSASKEHALQEFFAKDDLEPYLDGVEATVTVIDDDLNVPLLMLGSYLELDRPDSLHHAPVRGPQITTSASSNTKFTKEQFRALTATPLRLPLGPPALDDPIQAATLKSANEIEKSRARLTFEVKNIDFVARPVRAISIRVDQVGAEPLKVQAFQGGTDGIVEAIVDRPFMKGKSGEGSFDLRYAIETAASRYSGKSAAFKMDWGDEPPPSGPLATFTPNRGTTGALVTIEFAKHATVGPGHVAHVRFGPHLIAPGSAGGFWQAAPNKIALIAPLAVPGGRTSHLILELTPAGVSANANQARIDLGDFDYTELPR